MKKSVFISYSDLDKTKMNALLKKIRKNTGLVPIVVAYNRDPMLPLTQKVIDGINTSDYVVPILTSKSYKTQWINQEIGYATAKGKKIIPIVEQEIISQLKGFVNSQIDLSYNFSSIPDNQKRERAEFRKNCDLLIFDIINKDKIVPNKNMKKRPKTLSDIFKGKWLNEYEFPDGRKGKEIVEIKKGNRYYSNDRLMFELDKVTISEDKKTIQFQKNGINGDTRKALNNLELTTPGQYAGSEERNKVVYSKLSEDASILKKIERIEERKLKLSIEPVIRLKTVGRSPETFQVTIENIGENAVIDRVEIESGEISLNRINLPAVVDKNRVFRIDGRFITKTIDPDYSVNIYYSDRLQNKYIATVLRSNKKSSLKTKEVD